MGLSEAQHYEQDDLWGDDNIVNPAHHLARYAAVAAALPTGTASVIDVGAGDGRVLHHLAANGGPPLLVAAERSFRAVRHVRTPRVQASGDRLPFRDGAADAVVCCEVLEHLPRHVYDDVRAELARVASTTIVITVPNQEDRRRSAITCSSCGCRYNPDRHLRSFRSDDLADLFPGFRLVSTEALGPRPPYYPRAARIGLERLGVLQRPGAPSCPQCGEPYEHAAGNLGRGAPADAAPAGTSAGRTGAGTSRRAYDLARSLAPKVRQPYWLLGAYRRS